MTHRKSLWLLVAALSLGSPAQGREVRDGIEVELSGQGLDLLSGVLRDQVAGRLTDIQLPEVRDTLRGGIEVVLTDVHASLRLDSLRLRSTSDGLVLDAGLSDVTIDIASMRVDWGRLGTTCTGTTLRVAEGGTVTLTGVLGAWVEDDMIRMSPDQLAFPVGYDDYRATGPRACSGWWGVRDVARLMASGVLKSLWPFVESLVTGRVRDAVPSLEDKLNDHTHVSVMFDITGRSPFPDRTAELSAFPSAIETSRRGLRIVAGFRIRLVESIERPLVQSDQESMGPRLATAGLNPALLSEALAEIFPGGTESLELTDADVPGLGDMLKVRSLAGIWPDLDEAPLTGDRLRLFVRMTTPPTLKADDQSQSVIATVPRVELRFMAPVAQGWVDYFIVGMDLEAGLRVTSQGNTIALRLLPGHEVVLDGHWADGYQPRNDLFEKDLLRTGISMVLDVVRYDGPLAKVTIPDIAVGGRTVTIGNPHVRAPFVRVDAL